MDVNEAANLLPWPRGVACYTGGMTSTGGRIKHLRKRLGMSQAELARAIGVTQGAISLLESGRTEAPAGDTLARLCQELGTTPDFLMRGDGEDSPSIGGHDERRLLALWRALPQDGKRMVMDATDSAARIFLKR